MVSFNHLSWRKDGHESRYHMLLKPCISRTKLAFWIDLFHPLPFTFCNASKATSALAQLELCLLEGRMFAVDVTSI